MVTNAKAVRHNRFARYWALGIVVLCSTGLSTTWIDIGPFWKGYVLDMTGPAWNYILVRGLFTGYKDNAWTRFFTPNKTVILMVLVSYGIESLQFFKIYDSTFDPWDLMAYVSILIPVYLLDLIQTSKDD